MENSLSFEFQIMMVILSGLFCVLGWIPFVNFITDFIYWMIWTGIFIYKYLPLIKTIAEQGISIEMMGFKIAVINITAAVLGAIPFVCWIPWQTIASIWTNRIMKKKLSEMRVLKRNIETLKAGYKEEVTNKLEARRAQRRLLTYRTINEGPPPEKTNTYNERTNNDESEQYSQPTGVATPESVDEERDTNSKIKNASALNLSEQAQNFVSRGGESGEEIQKGQPTYTTSFIRRQATSNRSEEEATAGQRSAQNSNLEALDDTVESRTEFARQGRMERQKRRDEAAVRNRNLGKEESLPITAVDPKLVLERIREKEEGRPEDGIFTGNIHDPRTIKALRENKNGFGLNVEGITEGSISDPEFQRNQEEKFGTGIISASTHDPVSMDRFTSAMGGATSRQNYQEEQEGINQMNQANYKTNLEMEGRNALEVKNKINEYSETERQIKRDYMDLYGNSSTAKNRKIHDGTTNREWVRDAN